MVELKKHIIELIKNHKFKEFKNIITKKNMNLVLDNEGFTPLLYASYSSDVNIVEYLVKMGVEVNSTINDGDNALVFSAYNNNVEITKILLKTKIDINNKGYEEETPIFVAAQENSFEVFELLLKAGASLEINNKYKHNTLYIINSKKTIMKNKFKEIIDKEYIKSKIGKFANLLN